MSNEFTQRHNYIRFTNFNRVRGTPTDFVTDLTNDTRLHQASSVWIDKVTIPNLFYNIDTHNNRLDFSATNAGGAPAITDFVTVDPGFYTSTQLMAELETLINLKLVPVTGAITFTQNNINNLISFTTTGLDGISFYLFDRSSGQSSLSIPIGNTELYAEAPVGTFKSMPALSGESMIYLHSKDINLGNASISTLNNPIEQPNTNRNISAFCSIPVSVPFGSNISYNSFGSDVDKINLEGIKDLATVNIKLRAHDGRLLKLDENQELTIVLKIFY